MAELEAVDDERGGVLVVGPDAERGVVLWRAQGRAVLVPPEGDRQVALQNLKFFLPLSREKEEGWHKGQGR